MARFVPAWVILLVLTPVAGLQPGLASGQTWRVPRTSWNHPDLQGVWSTATITPLERTNRDRRDGGAEVDVARAYNDFWWDSGTRVVPTRRTALIIDPSDGRVPSLTPEAQQRQTALAEARKTRGPADNPEDRNLWERCISRGLPTVMLPQVYNGHYQIFQTRDHVVILAEMIHDARIIPLTGRPHPPAHLRFWLGDSVGRWEGESLDTVDDPTTFTRPWTIELPTQRSESEIYEYACHEANYGLEGILRGHRAQEKKTSDEAAKKTPK